MVTHWLKETDLAIQTDFQMVTHLGFHLVTHLDFLKHLD